MALTELASPLYLQIPPYSPQNPFSPSQIDDESTPERPPAPSSLDIPHSHLAIWALKQGRR